MKSTMKLIKALLVLLVPATLFAQNPIPSAGLAPTPPMGWNSWNKFACNVSEDLIKGMADAMVKSGMKDAGYQYIVIDDCWQVSRDREGNIVAELQHFPSGIKALADYVHSLGLKFGIYSDAGSKTCAGRPGGLGHEYQDALKYAAWGVDYLKYDWCNTTTQDARAAYANMRAALDATGRPIVLSICEWGNACRGCGALKWAATCGGQPATSRIAGRGRRNGSRVTAAPMAWSISWTPRMRFILTLAQGTGTIPTRWKWAMAG